MYRIVVSCGITSNSTVAGIKKGASNGGAIVLKPVEQLLSLVCIVPSGQIAPLIFSFDKLTSPLYSKAPLRYAPVKFAPTIFCGCITNTVLCRFAPVRLAPLRSTLKNIDSDKSELAKKF